MVCLLGPSIFTKAHHEGGKFFERSELSDALFEDILEVFKIKRMAGEGISVCPFSPSCMTH